MSDIERLTESTGAGPTHYGEFLGAEPLTDLVVVVSGQRSDFGPVTVSATGHDPTMGCGHMRSQRGGRLVLVKDLGFEMKVQPCAFCVRRDA